MLLALAALLLAIAIWLLSTRRQIESRSMPEGTILYEDVSEQRYTSNILTSQRYGLRGKPDYILMTKDGVVPVELKSTTQPPSRGRVHPSHTAQILAYCAIVGESLGERIPYGLVIYRDGLPRRVIPTEKNMIWLQQMADGLRAARKSDQQHRNHRHEPKCLNCGVRDNCTEALQIGQGWRNRTRTSKSHRRKSR